MTRAADARLSEHQKDLAVLAKQKKDAELAQLKADFNETFASPNGIRTLRFIMKLCGYNESPISVDPQSGDPMVNALIHNAARTNIYLTIRKFLRDEVLINAEFKQPTQDEVDDLLT